MGAGRRPADAECPPPLRLIVESARRKAYPGLQLLVLFGSRARDDAVPGSDWDLAYSAGPGFDPDTLLADVTSAVARAARQEILANQTRGAAGDIKGPSPLVGSDRVDLVDLDRAGGQLRFRAARDGCVLFEADEHAFERFWHDAVMFWCDIEPVVRPGYEAVLSRLSR